ncbi:MAG: hypothetical protein KGI50_07065 [Patescibacteria group bacterium]|nr:hypothetical protein [Patescibacteria group bacterium]
MIQDDSKLMRNPPFEPTKSGTAKQQIYSLSEQVSTLTNDSINLNDEIKKLLKLIFDEQARIEIEKGLLLINKGINLQVTQNVQRQAEQIKRLNEE